MSKKHYIIHCPLDEVDFGTDLTDVIKAQGDYYVISLVKDMKAISMKQVSKQEFDEYIKQD
jgi:hypothetical protein